MVVRLLGNKSPDSNRFILVTPKPENGVRLQATLGNQNPTGLPVGAVRAEWTDYPKKPLREVLGISLEDSIAWDGGSDEVLKMIAERKAY